MKQKLQTIKKLISRGLGIGLLSLGLGMSIANAQNITATSYPITLGTTGTLVTVPPVTTQHIASANDDTPGPLVPFGSGFTFTYGGVKYTDLSVSPDGFFKLGSVAAAQFTNDLLSTTNTPIIAPFWDDLASGTDGQVRGFLTGTAPNRIYVIDWFVTIPRNTVGAASGRFQCWLYENGGKIQFVYGAGITAGQSASIGHAITSGTVNRIVSATINTPFLTSTNAFSASPNNTNAAEIVSGSTITYTPPVPSASPTAMNFTGVTGNAITINWTDNATTETYYAVQRSVDGGANYLTLASLPANTVTYTATGLLPGQSYTFKVIAATEGNIDSSRVGTRATLPPSTITSTVSGGNWSDPLTWVGGVVPSLSDSVIINDGATVIIDSTAASCYALVVGQGIAGTLQYRTTPAATLNVSHTLYLKTGATFNAGTGTLTTHTLNVGVSSTTPSPGSIVNDGTLDFSGTAGANITFMGNINGFVTGTGTYDFRRITLNKGDVSIGHPVLTLNVAYTTEGANTIGMIGTHTAGIFQIGGTFTQSSPVYNSTTYTIPFFGGIWLNNPNFTVTALNGNPTLNGVLRVTQGTYNISTVNSALLAPGAGSHLWVEGGVLNHSARIISGNVFSFTMSGGVINVAKVGNTTSASASFGITSANSAINWTGGTVVLNQRSTGTTIHDYNVAPLTGFNGGTLQVGTSTTTTNYDFRLNGNIPKLTIDSITNNKIAMLRLQCNVRGNIYIPVGCTLNMNGQNLLFLADSVNNNGFIDGRTAASNFVYFGGAAQSHNGSGADTLQNLANQNTLGGVRFNKTVVAYRVNFFSATTFINSANIRLGNGLAQAVITQIGVANMTSVTGIFDVAPTFNLGTGTYSLVYAQDGALRNTGVEIPASRSVFNLTITDTNNVRLAGGSLDVTGTLTMTAGRLNTSDSTLLRITNTAATAANIGTTTSFVNGPLQRRLPASNTAAGTYIFPIGKGTTSATVELLNPKTNAGGVVEVLARYVDTTTAGTPNTGAGINALNNPYYWNISVLSGVSNLDSVTNVRVTRAGFSGINRLAYSSTLSGSYASRSGGPGVGIITSDPLVGSALEGFYTSGEIIVPITGNYLIGATKTSPDYTSITAFLNDIAGKQIQGNIIVRLDSDYDPSLEVFPITLNAFARSNPAFTITVKPNTGVQETIEANNGNATLIFNNNASNWIIDGSNNGTTSRDLTIKNNSSATAAVVRYIGTTANEGVSNSSLKNTVIRGGTNSASIGILVGGTTLSAFSNGAGYKDVKIENNQIYNTNYGIALSGTSATVRIKGITLKGNTLGTDSTLLSNRNYAIFTQYVDTCLIDSNRIYNMVANINFGTVTGIQLSTSSSNVTVSRNTIRGMRNTNPDGSGVIGIWVTSGTTGVNNKLINNQIFDVLSSNYNWGNPYSQYTPHGIFIQSGNDLKVYFNSVNLYGHTTLGTSVGTSSSLTIASSGIPGLDIRNNNIRNSMTSSFAGSKQYALVHYGASTQFNYNNYSINGSFAVLAYYITTAVDQTTLAEIQSTTSANANSKVINPSFVNDSTLMNGMGILDGLGIAISGITKDILDSVRATPPSIGAFEKGVDLSGPSITYTAITNTALLTNRVLTGFAAITDVSGVNTTTFKPRIYYRKSTDANAFGTYPADNNSSFNGWKYAEASNTTSPFNFTINYSLLFGGGSLTITDTIVYFVVAQDLKTPAFNVSANPAAGFSATNVNTIISGPTTPNKYVIVDAPLAGTYLVGSTQTAPNFTTITSAINSLNARGISAAVTFELTDATYSTSETFPLVITSVTGSSSINKVTIRPAASAVVAITGSSSSAIFTLNGASYVTIDGSNTPSGTTRDLTITNTNTGGSTAVIWNSSLGLGQGSTRNTFKNCKLYNGSTSSANYGVFVGGSGIGLAGADNDFVTIQNDTIGSAATPIAALGTTAVSAGANDSLSIIENTMTYNGSAAVIGIQVGNSLNASVSKNRLDLQTSSTQITGISLETGFLSSTVTRNNIVKANTSSTGGYAGRGITVGTGSATSNVTIANNFVSGINGSNWSAFGNSSTLGIGIGIIGNSGTLTTVAGGINLYYNTVNVYGSMGTGNGSAITTALYIGSAATDLNVKNNIFSNVQTATSTTQSNYAVYCAAPNSVFTSSNYNNYYVVNTFNAASAKIGWMAGDQITLANWKTATAKDVNSINDSTNFVSSSDLHITGTTVGNTIYVGSPVAGTTIDIDGETRVALYPYIGADENTVSPLPVVLTSFTATTKANDVLLNWSSASELNNKGFEVERSVDGRNFDYVTFVKGAGNSSRQLNYNLTDAEAFDVAASNVLYYRLKQIDFDGKFTYSNVVRVSKTTAEVNALSIFPNPYSTDYSISFTATNSGKASVEMTDIQGKTVASFETDVISGTNTLLMGETAGMRAGIYFVQLTVNGETQVLKLVKN